MSDVLLIDGDILVYNTIYACAEETKLAVVSKTAEALHRNICTMSGCDKYLSFLTHSSSNFRIARATTWPYKGNRKHKEKPVWYGDIRDHYLTKQGYQMMRGVEADDALTIAAEVLVAQGHTVACATKDKDLKQYPWDKFVDLNTDKVYSISEEQAHEHLWLQMLIGDKSTDNIPGLSHAARHQWIHEHTLELKAPRHELLGAKGAQDLLDSWDPKDYAEKTLEMYLDAYETHDPVHPKAIESCETLGIPFGEYRYHETWDLVHMLLEKPEGLVINYDLLDMPKPKKASVSMFTDFSLGD